MTVIMAFRLVITYETPLGTRTLSSSTRTSPARVADQVHARRHECVPRCRAGCPTRARWKWVEEVTSWLGMTPSAITRASE